MMKTRRFIIFTPNETSGMVSGKIDATLFYLFFNPSFLSLYHQWCQLKIFKFWSRN